jgi:hypothetical protein
MYKLAKQIDLLQLNFLQLNKLVDFANFRSYNYSKEIFRE